MSESLLVVTGHKSILASVTEILEAEDRTVIGVRSAEEAVRLLSSQNFKLVLISIDPPALDCGDLIRRVRPINPEIEIIALCPIEQRDAAIEAMKQGAFAYLITPIASGDELRLVVARALERRHLKTRIHHDVQVIKPSEVIANDPSMKKIMTSIRRIAATGAIVLIEGDPGTGKGFLARTAHSLSSKRNEPFVEYRCSHRGDPLSEGALWGYERGAFPEASRRFRGLIELAEGGTLYLSNISSLRSGQQQKLLLFLKTGTYERIGGTRCTLRNLRIIASCQGKLSTRVAEGNFHGPLEAALSRVRLAIPPLSERQQDILPLAREYLAELSEEIGRPRLVLSKGAEKCLLEHNWPENLRELRNRMEWAALLCKENTILAEHIF